MIPAQQTGGAGAGALSTAPDPLLAASRAAPAAAPAAGDRSALPSTPASLPPAPGSLLLPGGPAWGRHAGRLPALDWQGRAPVGQRTAAWRWLRHKRWHYVGIQAGPVFIGLAIVDVGWCRTAFAYLHEAGSGLLAEVRRDAPPGWGQVSATVGGAGSRLALPGAAWSLQSVPDGLAVRLRSRALDIDARLRTAPPPAAPGEPPAAPWLLAVGTVAGGGPHATQKSPALPVSGQARAGGRTFRLDGGMASIDSSAGYLPRETAWRWASAHAPGLGFNLQAGYFGEQENALWLDGRLIPLAAARFDFDAAQPLRPWHIATDDGLLDLVFTPQGARAEDRQLLLAASHYVQPIGRFDGTVRPAAGAAPRAVSGLIGVTEDHRSRW